MINEPQNQTEAGAAQARHVRNLEDPRWVLDSNGFYHVCSYCFPGVAPSGELGGHKVSHGICKPCADRMLAEFSLEMEGRAA